MENNSKNLQRNLAFDLFSDILHEDDLEYIYRGHFTQNITKNILALTETNLEHAKDTQKIKNRIYFIMTEGLQNISKHQDKLKEDLLEESGIFAIQKKNKKYYITTGNLVENDKIDILKNMLNRINNMDRKELKQLHKQILVTGELSEKGGAGLGLIEMARKSGNKLSFEFKTIDQQYAFFYLNTEIPTQKQGAKKEGETIAIEAVEEVHNGSIATPLDSIIKLHDILNEKNILLNFKGSFNQENLIHLLSLIEDQMKKTKRSSRTLSIMVEMLQNILRHADDCNVIGNPGIFFINRRKNKIFLTAGNHIFKEKEATLRQTIDFVNNLSEDELDNIYNKILLGMEVDTEVEIGLGLLDIRMKSGNKLIYEFDPIDDKFTFFTIQTGISSREA